VNVGSHAYYIGDGGGVHCPLIEGIAYDQGGELDLIPCEPNLLEINSNRCKAIEDDLSLSIIDLKLWQNPKQFEAP
jgi:hypothetical protein